MVNLILVIMAIALTAGMLGATLNYLPTSRGASDTSYATAKQGLATLENAFKAYAKAHAGASLTPDTGQADGGLTGLQPYYAFLPKAPGGMAWKYGAIAGTSPQEYYFCLYPTNSAGAEQGTVQGLARLRTIFSNEQFFIAGYTSSPSENCGIKSGSWADPSAYPAKVSYTYAVRYVELMP